MAPSKAALPESLVTELVRDEPSLLASLDFGSFVRQGEASGARLFIGDQAAIELFSPELQRRNDHRMALLAKPGDVVVVRKRDVSCEAYLEKYLGRGAISYLEADATDPSPVAKQCLTNRKLWDVLVAALAEKPSLTLHPYIACGHVWRLAQALGQALGHVVHVAGPGPRISRHVNDKLWYWSLARKVAGVESVPPTFHAYGPAAAAGQIARLAAQHESVVVKVPGSAGSVGNIRVDSHLIRGMGLSNIRTFLHERLAAIGWRGKYPVLVGVWETGVVASPSIQIRLPQPTEGEPEVLGLFEQRVVGPEGAFSGAKPAQLEDSITRAMVEEAKRMGKVLQHLGYYGPCSFDAIVRKTKEGERQLHWIECNGRWTGVSIPFMAAKALLGGASPKGLVIVQEDIPHSTLDCTSKLRILIEDLLYRPGEREDGVVIVSPPAMVGGASLNIIAISDSQPVAELLASEVLQRVTAAD